MTDLLYILALIFITSVDVAFADYEATMQRELSAYDQNMATLWVESEATTNRLKECQRRKKR